MIIEIHYKLRCLGLQIERSSTLVGNNQSVILNTTLPALKVKKKHLLCQIMQVQEAIASGAVNFAKAKSQNNYADGLTKPLPPLQHHCTFHDFLF